MIISWIKQYILPKEVDFLSALSTHAVIIQTIVDNLEQCYLHPHTPPCKAMIEDQKKASQIRDSNMNELLNTFITPIDRESIYRVITELDWIAISIKHFALELHAYKIVTLDQEYASMIQAIKKQADHLSLGFQSLRKDDQKTAQTVKEIRDTYDTLMLIYIQKMAKLSNSDNTKEIFIHQSLLWQLKEISKRMRMTANSLEDIIMKMA